MTSERKARASRANARRSTGPRSGPGKARAAMNAHRHGLSQDILADPTLAAEIETLSEQVAQSARPHDLRDLARRVAEAQVDLRRIRHYRVRRTTEAVSAAGAGTANGCAAPEAFAAAIAPLLKELLAIERYERRALSRRKFAIRDFERARRQGASGLETWAVLRPPRRRPRPKLRPPAEPICVSEYVYLAKWLKEQGRAIMAASAAAVARATAPLSNEEKFKRMLEQMDAERGGSDWRRLPAEGT